MTSTRGTHRHRTRRPLAHARLIIFLIPPLACACENIEWNWQSDWWREPRRVVRPTRPPIAPAEEASSPPSEEPIVSAPAPEQRNAGVDSAGATPSDSASRQPTGLNRAFYQLYLVSGDAKPEDMRGENQVRLRNASARICAAALEMLYVPLGRSGSAADCYLLYEDRSEFDAAAAFAPLLDVSPLARAASTVGARQAFTAGVGMLLAIIEQGPVVDRALAETAEARLVEAARAETLEPRVRWAAAVLAGRVASEYRYDYASARSNYTQAARVTTADSLERAVALYWRADAWALEGRRDESTTLYEEILAGYGPKAPKSELVRRAQAVLRKSQRK